MRLLEHHQRHSVVSFSKTLYHARDPLYSNSAVIAWWLQSTSAQKVYITVKKGNILVNILLQKIFLANYCHLLIQLGIYLTKFLWVE